MKNEFCTYEQALALKELGFEESCLAHLIGFGDGTKENGRYKIIQQQVFYPNDYTKSDDKAEELGLYPFGICGVPLKQQCMRWFREKYGYLASPFSTGFEECKVIYYFEIGKINNLTVDVYSDDKPSYEEAEDACIDKLIELVKK